MLDIQKTFVEACAAVDTTDKVSHHGYHRTYPLFLDSFRNKSITMLEIGVDRQGSLELWRNYFNNCIYFGVDIAAKKPESEIYPNFYILYGDQSNRGHLESISNRINSAEFIIDDGSHDPAHQVSTFNFLFDRLLSPGGVYIIEDIETSYWKRHKLYGNIINYGVGHPRSLIERIKSIIDCVNSEFTNSVLYTSSDFISHHCQNSIESITFSHNSIIFVKKDYSSFGKYYDRVYRSHGLV